jgi:RNA polymerase sigma-70 factor (ECF subfamily)
VSDAVDGFLMDAIYRDYYDHIRRYIQGLIRDPREAEDLTQEAFLRAYRSRAVLREPRALTTWLYRIATNVCVDRARQRQRRAPHEDAGGFDRVEVADTRPPSLERRAEQREMSACVQTHVEDLPYPYRAVVLLHDQHGLTGSEIADILGVSLATVKVRLHRARRRLEASLTAGCNFSHDERSVLVCESKTALSATPEASSP